MLELKNVVKTYKTKSGEVNALNGVSLTFPETGLIFIVGKSGCGKTTFLNAIGGLDGIDGGEIELFGKPFSSFTQAEYNDYRNTFVGFIFQEYNLLPEFTVEKNIQMAMELQGGSCDKDELEEMLNKVEITGLKNRKPNELSGGQRQRVAIARALIKKPRIIMADEPTGALDSNTGIQVLELLKKLSKERLIIIVSHEQDFAETYADRIIRFVDGNVAEDITFNESPMAVNVCEKGDTLLVKEGADLSEEDKNVVAKAIKTRQKLEIISNLTYRQKETTDEKKINKKVKKVELQRSKMKFKSSFMLGLKSLGVKPLRLVFTILLSVMAFAVFGLFDTVATFTTKGVVDNLVATTDSLSLYGNYVLDKQYGDSYPIKLSTQKINEFSNELDTKVKGVYHFYDNVKGAIDAEMSIFELFGTNQPSGKNYYTKSFTGFVEFGLDEIDSNGQFKDFNYKLVAGEYPELSFTSEQDLQASMKKIAISTYMADSIKHFLNNNNLDGERINIYPDLLGKRISVEDEIYTIVGVIDCGKIDSKYGVLKDDITLDLTLKTLADDFKKVINAGAERCMFVADGTLEQHNLLTKTKTTIYYGGSANWYARVDNKRHEGHKYLYSSNGFDGQNLMLFNATSVDTPVTLADDQTLIHISNLKTLYSEEYFALDNNERVKFTNYLSQMYSQENSPSYKLLCLKEIVRLLNIDTNGREIELSKSEQNTGKIVSKRVKVVGIYIDIDQRESSSVVFRFMMNDNLMNYYKVCTDQGDYSRILINAKGNGKVAKAVTDYMLSEEGFSLVWYQNSALNTIKANEPVIRQGADLFLYVAIALAVFSMVMLFNYIATSIVNKRQSIGVLRGLGAGGKDILSMFLIESLIISLINAVFAVGLGALGCVFVNMYIAEVMFINIPFAIFGFRQAIIIVALSLVTAVVSSAMPIYKISKEKPVDLIRRP